MYINILATSVAHNAAKFKRYTMQAERIASVPLKDAQTYCMINKAAPGGC